MMIIIGCLTLYGEYQAVWSFVNWIDTRNGIKPFHVIQWEKRSK